MALKVYVIEMQGTCTYVAAHTNVHALKLEMEQSELFITDYDDTDSVRPLLKSQWERIAITDMEGNNISTVKQYMETDGSAGIICSTAYAYNG